DPLDAADTGDNYGVIMLADVMLKVARRTGDSALEGTGERILRSALTLPVPSDPFNLLAIAAVIHDGQGGDLPAGVWERAAGPLIQRAGQIGPPIGNACLIEPRCYDNWRLVWSAGAALLLMDGVGGAPGSLAGESDSVAALIETDLRMAVTHAGAPLLASVAREAGHESGDAGYESREAARKRGEVERKRAKRSGSGAGGTLTTSALGGRVRELSDPGAEPPAYELFSTFMLELISEVAPRALTPAVARLRRQADRYALDMMAPDGQLSLSGRSLDQSWVQAAAAALGARRAALDPADASAWRGYADRAVSYLLAAYPLRRDNLLPIVPGLGTEWNPSIMDGYAALNQYEGLTLWLLSDALARWPRTQASRASLPADNQDLLAGDLASSGLVWGRAGGVWWELGGRSSGGDPRSAQGLVAVKVSGADGWRDLLALRPRQHGLSSVWTLGLAHGRTATPTFTKVRGAGRRAVLSGSYRQANGHILARTTWTLSTTATGIRLSMRMPAKATLHTTVWLAGEGSPRLRARAATTQRGACVVTASGRACPVTIHWRDWRAAVLELSS
ncbi:MAG TPA: hypothetical protein VFV03_07725, partial [Solirubrobacteraceae bacterium]|nr:hypothetical protein [Solirubrobacteraceae bacterium]